jgi:hypothetical protein
MQAHFPQSSIQFNNLHISNILHDEYPRSAIDFEMCDNELKQILTTKQLDTFKTWDEQAYKENGDFIPISYYL